MDPNELIKGLFLLGPMPQNEMDGLILGQVAIARRMNSRSWLRRLAQSADSRPVG